MGLALWAVCSGVCICYTDLQPSARLIGALVGASVASQDLLSVTCGFGRVLDMLCGGAGCAQALPAVTQVTQVTQVGRMCSGIPCCHSVSAGVSARSGVLLGLRAHRGRAGGRKGAAAPPEAGGHACAGPELWVGRCAGGYACGDPGHPRACMHASVW